MKAFIAGLGAVFALLLGATIYVAAVSDEGLVEDGYYARARTYLAEKEMEESVGLIVRPVGRLAAGRNRFGAVVATSTGPLRGAAAALHAMRLSGPGADARSILREEAPGRYAGEIVLPEAGEWLLRLTVDHGPLRAERRWIATATPPDPPAPGDAKARPAHRPAGRDIHAGPVSADAGGQAVILEILPRPVRSMRALSFAVALPGAAATADALRIDLGMPGMRMPPNRVDLRRGTDGIYRGQGTIVRCGSGRRTWSATVTAPGGARAVFTFDVAD